MKFHTSFMISRNRPGAGIDVNIYCYTKALTAQDRIEVYNNGQFSRL